MSYGDSVILAIGEGEADGATLGFAASGTAVLEVRQPCDLYEVGALIRVALTSNAAALTVTRRILPNSDVGATAVAILTIPAATAVGKIVHKPCHILTVAAPVKLNAGDELKFVWDSGGGAVYWKPWFEAYPRPETKDNNSDFILSA